jgi:hypothetical protein
MFYVRAICHTTDINTIVCPNRPEHIFVNTCNSCCDIKGADLVLTSRKKAWKMFVSFLYATTEIVSTTLTVLILHNVESVYFFYSDPV